MLVITLIGCQAAEDTLPEGNSDEEQPSAIETAPAIFIDISESANLRFQHDNGDEGKFYMPEIMGAGGALLDFDNDGDLDLYLVQGGKIEGNDASNQDRLFRNDLIVDGIDTGVLKFKDITADAEIPKDGYGMGVATGDIDADGFTDLYISNFGANRLLKNLGDGRFADITEQSGTQDKSWTVPATFLDVDADGDLDLFAGSYVDFRLANHRDCFSGTGLPDYCSPHSYSALTDRLFINNGHGVFTDGTASSGFRRVPSKALGVITGDFDNDGRIDLYVANDGVANQLWLNQGGGLFEDDALFAGCALNYEGLPEASMGIDSADIDGDGDEDIFMTHLRGETNTLYINNGDGTFEDRTINLGLAGPSIPYTGFGTAWLDVDNDGKLDLLAVNGAVTVEESLVQEGDSFPYHQPNQLFQNVSDGESLTFQPYPNTANDPLAASYVSRGALIGDLDNDGDQDIVITNNNGPARLLRNELGQQNSWLGLEAKLAANGAAALGATLQLINLEGTTKFRRVRTSSSYVSASDHRVVFGLGESAQESYQVIAKWPDGSRESFVGLTTNQYHPLIRGQGQPLDAQ